MADSGLTWLHPQEIREQLARAGWLPPGEVPRRDHVVNAGRQIESPDSLELLRTRCPECGHQVAVAIWCHDPACCNQSPFGFLIEELATAQAARGFPVFAVRYPEPLPSYSPDLPVRVWCAGS
jgi:hypothetical protein